MPPRLTKIDELTRDLHYHLSADDACYYLREYTSGAGYNASETNQLISNLKKGVDRRGRPEYRHKEIAIVRAGNELRAALNPTALAEATLVPIPPSASKNDPLYDDRMTRIIRGVAAGIKKPDIRELIVTRESVAPAHRVDERPSVDEILANYEIDEELTEPAPKSIVLFDDVLTAGSHFKACQRLLSERFPGVPIAGVFIARRIFPEQGAF